MRHFLPVVIVAMAILPCALAHGYLKIPASRNYIANSDYCPQCLSSGGPGVVGSGAKIWPDGQHGLCGDPYTQSPPRNHEAGGIYWGGGAIPDANKLVAGSVAKLSFVLTAYHKGRIGFRVCKINGVSAANETAQLTEDCFNKNVLLQANDAHAQAPGDRYYHLQPSTTGAYDAYYQIPSDLNCDGVNSRCVLQWYYLTGNSCNPPNEPSTYLTSGLSTCGPGAPYPEEFWNCASVSVTSGSGSPIPLPSPSPSPSPTPLASPPPSPSQSPPPAIKNNPPPPPLPLPSPSPKSPPPPSPTTTSPTPAASTPAAFCSAIGKYGFFADKSSGCSNFYRCESTGSWSFTCPSGLKFNEQISSCDFPANVSC